MTRGRIAVLFLAAIFAAGTLSAQRISREEYILKYKDIAIEHMEIYGIPASIKMAQALLESDNGNSRLAKEANNHFGIKCRSTWNGETISHHDDASNECFRKYGSAEDSFADHSEFLDSSPRYDALFKLDPKDYKAWAAGLREAGYATNPSYAQLLIKVIEDNKLYLLDEGVNVTYADIRRVPVEVVIDENTPRINIDNLTVTIDKVTGREMGFNNGVPYVVARTGDSYGSIAATYGVKLNKLLKLNDLAASHSLNDGDIVYTKKKKKRSENGNLLYVIEPGDTMHSISQKFGIRLKNLYTINNMSTLDTIRAGQQIRLK